MSTIIEKAKNNNRKALKRLYDTNKNKVSLICKLFLDDDNAVNNAVITIFKDAFKKLKTESIMSESEFTEFINSKAVNVCKKNIQKRNSKAYQLPSRKVFNDNNELQKLIYISCNVVGLSNEKLSKATELNNYTINMVLESDLSDIPKLLKIQEIEGNLKISEKVEEEITKIIADISKNNEKERVRKNIIIIAMLCIAMVLSVLVIYAVIDKNNGKKDNAKELNQNESTSSIDLGDSDESVEYVSDINPDWYADIDIDGYGIIKVGLDSSYAPVTVENFVSLCQSGFYDGLTFHRIIEDFMMQGGDPNGNGTGGSKDNIYGEFTDNGSDNNLSHIRGAISMARSSDYDSASSQFFIVHKDSTFLDGQYAVFGYVIEGMDIVDEICTSAEPTDSNGTIDKEQQPVIKSITVYQ